MFQAGYPVLAQASSPTPTPVPPVVIKEILTQTLQDPPSTGLDLGFGDKIDAAVENLEANLNDSAAVHPLDPKKLVLFLDGHPVPGDYGQIVKFDPPKGMCSTSDCEVLEFTLTPEPEVLEIEKAAAAGGPDGKQETVEIGAGPEDGKEFATTSGDSVVLQKYSSEPGFWLAVVLLVPSLAIYILLAIGTNLVRDITPVNPSDPTSTIAPPSPVPSLKLLAWCGSLIRSYKQPLPRRPYSLARFQMAWWFAIVGSSYLFILFLTGQVHALTDQAIALMGISTGTTMGSALIDAGKDGTGTNTEDSRGFFQDVLTDNTGIVFHRFQALVWTMVMGGIFLWKVWHNLAMPDDFSGNELALMGISSATYLGLKIPEVQTPATG